MKRYDTTLFETIPVLVTVTLNGIQPYCSANNILQRCGKWKAVHVGTHWENWPSCYFFTYVYPCRIGPLSKHGRPCLDHGWNMVKECVLTMFQTSTLNGHHCQNMVETRSSDHVLTMVETYSADHVLVDHGQDWLWSTMVWPWWPFNVDV